MIDIKIGIEIRMLVGTYNYLRMFKESKERKYYINIRKKERKERYMGYIGAGLVWVIACVLILCSQRKESNIKERKRMLLSVLNVNNLLRTYRYGKLLT